ncbi:Transmembrane protein 244 [Acipenser ruthenus]|uniref:Transmembrane protein 244 n=1 Tax=Acipenser ruthenus TaxID=7906 RepID=A0A444UMI9_ACIRT|nr:Transmembrane protein 244 [Acipenser ruthenus]
MLCRIEDIDSLLAPFDFKTSPSWTNSKYVGKFHWEHKYEGPIPEMGSYSYGHILLLHSNPSSTVNLISAEVTFFISGLMFALIVEEWVWDYAITVTLIHVGLTTVGPSSFVFTKQFSSTRIVYMMYEHMFTISCKAY